MTFYHYLDWPLGRLLLVSDGEMLTGLYFVDGRHVVEPLPAWRRDASAEPFASVSKQLHEYWQGQRRTFDVPMRIEGTPFQQRVWTEITAVGFGTTLSYRDLAERSGAPNASRAAGLATGRNPISIIVPCHRIVGTNGSLTGYGGGLGRKKALLEFEAGAGWLTSSTDGRDWHDGPGLVASGAITGKRPHVPAGRERQR